MGKRGAVVAVAHQALPKLQVDSPGESAPGMSLRCRYCVQLPKLGFSMVGSLSPPMR